ncbi:MAG: RNA polymerase sigma factor [Dehalococcoidia bacterium]
MARVVVSRQKKTEQPELGPVGLRPAPEAVDEFASRYNEYFPKVFAYLYSRVQNKEAAQDLVAEVFEKAFAKSADLRSDDAFGAWLFTIARNVVASYWRKQKPAAGALRAIGWQSELAEVSPEESVLERERIAILLDLVQQLPQREQDILALKFDAELANRDIAKIMAISEVNVRVILYRTLRKLRDQMRVM